MIKFMYGATTALIICGIAVYNIPERVRIIEKTVFVDTHFIEEVEVPRDMTMNEKVEALAIAIDGGYTPPITPRRKPKREM